MKLLQNICLSGFFWILSTNWSNEVKSEKERLLSNTYLNSLQLIKEESLSEVDHLLLPAKIKNRKRARIGWRDPDEQNEEVKSGPLNPEKLKLNFNNPVTPGQSILSKKPRKKTQKKSDSKIKQESNILTSIGSEANSPTRKFTIGSLTTGYHLDKESKRPAYQRKIYSSQRISSPDKVVQENSEFIIPPPLALQKPVLPTKTHKNLSIGQLPVSPTESPSMKIQRRKTTGRLPTEESEKSKLTRTDSFRKKLDPVGQADINATHAQNNVMAKPTRSASMKQFSINTSKATIGRRSINAGNSNKDAVNSSSESPVAKRCTTSFSSQNIESIPRIRDHNIRLDLPEALQSPSYKKTMTSDKLKTITSSNFRAVPRDTNKSPFMILKKGSSKTSTNKIASSLRSLQ